MLYAIYGLFTCQRDPPRQWFFAILAIAGSGSLAFHGTLKYVGQLADELPMVYIALTCMYCLWAAEQVRTDRQRVAAVASLALYALLWSAVHTIGGYTTAFQV